MLWSVPWTASLHSHLMNAGQGSLFLLGNSVKEKKQVLPPFLLTCSHKKKRKRLALKWNVVICKAIDNATCVCIFWNHCKIFMSLNLILDEKWNAKHWPCKLITHNQVKKSPWWAMHWNWPTWQNTIENYCKNMSNKLTIFPNKPGEEVLVFEECCTVLLCWVLFKKSLA